MEKVCLLLRVSTNAQDYEYQYNTLIELCVRKGWEIVKVFANKVSGAKKNEERQEIVELIDFVRNNMVDRVVATEISRIGRDTLEALKTIEILNEHKVNLYLANYNLETLNPDGSINAITKMTTTICLEISSFERNLLRYRMLEGYRNYLERRKEDKEKHPLGRKTEYRKSEDAYRQQYKQELTLLRKGISLRNVQQLTGTSVGTLRKLKTFL